MKETNYTCSSQKVIFSWNESHFYTLLIVIKILSSSTNSIQETQARGEVPDN